MKFIDYYHFVRCYQLLTEQDLGKESKWWHEWKDAVRKNGNNPEYFKTLKEAADGSWEEHKEEIFDARPWLREK